VTKRSTPRIALISATTAAIPPISTAFADTGVELWNILDDRLLSDADDDTGLTPALRDRMRRLISHAVTEGVDGILLTCSYYGSVVPEARPELDVPIFAADEAVFAAVLAGGHRSVLVVSPAEGPLRDSLQRLRAEAIDRGVDIETRGIVPTGAFEASRAGYQADLIDAIEHGVAAELGDAPELGGIDAILLAQYSLSPAAAALSASTGLPVYTGPGAARDALIGAIGAIGASDAAGATGAIGPRG
jgi:Asp/Glu/hydantoin racemase